MPGKKKKGKIKNQKALLENISETAKETIIQYNIQDPAAPIQNHNKKQLIQSKILDTQNTGHQNLKHSYMYQNPGVSIYELNTSPKIENQNESTPKITDHSYKNPNNSTKIDENEAKPSSITSSIRYKPIESIKINNMLIHLL